MQAASREAWDTWFRAWFAWFWLPSDLPPLRALVRLYDAVERGEFQRASELRLWLDGYGITPKGRQDRRIRPPASDADPEVGRRLVAGITVICGSWNRNLGRRIRFGRAERTVHAGSLTRIATPCASPARHGARELEQATSVPPGRNATMLLDSAPPRVRTVAVDGQPDVEVELESYATFTSTDLLPIESWPGMLAGVSTRWYPHALEPVGAAVAA